METDDKVGWSPDLIKVPKCPLLARRTPDGKRNVSAGRRIGGSAKLNCGVVAWSVAQPMETKRPALLLKVAS